MFSKKGEGSSQKARLTKQRTVLVPKYKFLIFSFILPVIILQLAYALQAIYPFGNRSLLIIDLYHQYAPFLEGLRTRILSFASPFYSWMGGLGTSFIPLYSYYLATPLNLLIVLFPPQHLTEAVLLLQMLKVGLTGLFFAYYLKEAYREKGPVMIIFSVMYALSAYVIAYSWNIMWMDVLYLLPLVVLGAVRIVKGRSGLLFYFSVIITVICNFYVAFFVCIFMAIYFPVLIFQNKQKNGNKYFIKNIGRFTVYFILAIGTTAVFMLPTWTALRLTSAAKDTFPGVIEHYFDLIDYIRQHFMFISPTIREGMPNMYSSIIVMASLPMFFLVRSIKHSIKLLYAGVLFILIVSFNTNYLDFIWHGFHFPNQLPYRYSFVYIFLVVTIAYQGFRKLNEFSRKQIGAIFLACLGLLFILQKLYKDKWDMFEVYAVIIFIVAYAAVLTLKTETKEQKRLRITILLIVVIIEITANSIWSVNKIDLTESYSSRNGYLVGTEEDDIRMQLSLIKKRDNDFFRMEITPSKTCNDPFLYTYRGISIFASTYPERFVDLMRRFGYQNNGINSFNYDGSTIVMDSIFSVKYLIRRNKEIKDFLREQIASTDEINIYKNPYALSLGFIADSKIKKWDTYPGIPFKVQNSFIYVLCGVENIFAPLKQDLGSLHNVSLQNTWGNRYHYSKIDSDLDSMISIKIKIEEAKQVYLYFDKGDIDAKEAYVMIDDKRVDFDYSSSTLIDLGYCDAKEDISLKLKLKKSCPESGSFEVHSYALNSKAFKQAMSILKGRQLKVEHFTESSVKGRVYADNDSVMLMSIPYDRGWRVKVDKRKVNTYPVGDAFLAFDMPKGEHVVEVYFIPEKILLGLFISIVCIIMMTLLAWRRSKNQSLKSC